MNMTLDEFFERLDHLPSGWHLAKHTNGWVRYDRGEACPIVAVAQAALFDKKYSNDEWPDAARAIGLSNEDAQDIVDAADNYTRAKPALRARLLTKVVA